MKKKTWNFHSDHCLPAVWASDCFSSLKHFKIDFIDFNLAWTQPSQRDCLVEQDLEEQQQHQQQQQECIYDGKHDGSVSLQLHENLLHGAWCREQRDDGRQFWRIGIRRKFWIRIRIRRQSGQCLWQRFHRHLPYHAEGQLLILKVQHHHISCSTSFVAKERWQEKKTRD